MAGDTTGHPQATGRSFLPALLCACLLLVAAARLPAEDIAKITPSGFVTDLAGVIPPASRERLETLAGELERKTGAQLAVVTVRSLEERPVEDYAVDLFKHLGVGAKKADNGVLLLLAPNERKYRIEVGYGLEPIINDARAGDVGRAMVPFLRQDDYGRAVETAAWQLAQWIAENRGVTLSGNPPAPARAPAPRGQESPIGALGLLVLLLVVFLLVNRSARAGRRGGMDGCWWILPLFLGGRGGGGGWSGGGWGGGGFGGGGGGFGGFGGGSSGGGGASGSW